MKQILMLLLSIPLTVMATDRPPTKPPVTREVHTQSGGGDNVEKYALGVVIGFAFCAWNPFEWKVCASSSEPKIKLDIEKSKEGR